MTDHKINFYVKCPPHFKPVIVKHAVWHCIPRQGERVNLRLLFNGEHCELDGKVKSVDYMCAEDDSVSIEIWIDGDLLVV